MQASKCNYHKQGFSESCFKEEQGYFKLLYLKKTLVHGKYYRRNRLVTSSACKTCLVTHSTHLITRSTCLTTCGARLSTGITCLSTHLSICLSMRSTRLSTRSICVSTRSTRSTISRSFYNWSFQIPLIVTKTSFK